MRFRTIALPLLFATVVNGPAVRASEFARTNLVLTVADKGKIVIRLYSEEAPLAVSAISKLAKEGFYDGQKFFKVVRQPRPFLIQFGDPQTKTKPLDSPTMGTGGTGRKIAYENSGYTHVRGAVGLSHLPEDKNTGDCQFYIMLGTYGFLDGNYTVFGQVTEGLDLLDKIEQGDQVTKVALELPGSKG